MRSNRTYVQRLVGRLPAFLAGAASVATIILMLEHHISVLVAAAALFLIADCIGSYTWVVSRRQKASAIHDAEQARLAGERIDRKWRQAANEATQILPSFVQVRDRTTWVPRTQVGQGPLAFDLMRDLAENTGDLSAARRM